MQAAMPGFWNTPWKEFATSPPVLIYYYKYCSALSSVTYAEFESKEQSVLILDSMCE